MLILMTLPFSTPVNASLANFFQFPHLAEIK